LKESFRDIFVIRCSGRKKDLDHRIPPPHPTDAWNKDYNKAVGDSRVPSPALYSLQLASRAEYGILKAIGLWTVHTDAALRVAALVKRFLYFY